MRYRDVKIGMRVKVIRGSKYTRKGAVGEVQEKLDPEWCTLPVRVVFRDNTTDDFASAALTPLR